VAVPPAPEKVRDDHRLRGISAAMAVLLVAFGVYYVFYVRRQIDYFASRNLRLLNTIATQVETAIRENGSKGRVPKSRTELLTPICEQTFLREFDNVVLANDKGVVAFRCQDSVRLASLDRLPVRAGWGDGKPLAFATLRGVSRSVQTTFGGSAYRLFSQPLHFDAGTFAEYTVVAGVISEARFTRESLAISYTLLIAVLAFLVLAILSLPYVRLGLIGELQRVRLSDVLLLGICTVFGIALLTLILLDGAGYYRMKRVTDDQLRSLASDIKRHMLRELDAAERVLNELDGTFVATTAARPLTNLEFFGTPAVVAFPHFESFSRINRDGMQVAKGSTAPKETQLVDVQGRDYFRDARDDRYTRNHVAIQSIRAITTGTTEAVIAKKSTRYSPTDTRPEAFPMIAAVSFPMRSVIDPVIAAGYQFAVIDQDGRVQFHSDSQRNTFENLFDETDDNPSLRAAVFGRQNEILNMRYWGTDHRAFVTPIDGTPWTLVTFRNKRFVRALNVETIMIALVFLVVYALGYAVVLASIAVVRPSYRAPWLWFEKQYAYDYRRLIYSYAALIVCLLCSIYLYQPRQLVVLAFLVPAMAMLLTYVRLKRNMARIPTTAMVALGVTFFIWIAYASNVRNSEPDITLNETVVMWVVLLSGAAAVLAILLPPWKKRKGADDTGARRYLLVPGYAYSLAAILLLAVVSILPTAAFFKAAFKIEIESFVKYGQVDVIEAFDRRAAAFRKLQHEWLRSSAEQEPKADMAARARYLIQHADADNTGIYHYFFFETRLAREPAAAKIPPDTLLARLARPFLSQAYRLGTAQPDYAAIPSFLERLLPHYSKESVRMRKLLHSKATSGEWNWFRRGDTLECRPSRWPDFKDVVVWSKVSRILDVPSQFRPSAGNLRAKGILYADTPDYTAVRPDSDIEAFVARGGLMIFAVILYFSIILWAVRFINQRIFLIDVDEPLWLKPGEKIGPALAGNLLIFTDDRARTMQSIVRDSFIAISAKRFAKTDEPGFWQRLMTQIDMAPGGKGLLIPGFDTSWNDVKIRAGLLRFVELATRIHHRDVMILTTTSPWILFGEIDSAEATRWSSILSSFTVRIDDGTAVPKQKRQVDYGKPLAESLDQFVRTLRKLPVLFRTGPKEDRLTLHRFRLNVNRWLRLLFHTSMKHAARGFDFGKDINGSERHAIALIDRECIANPSLKQLGTELKAQKDVRGEEQLYDEIGERAASYYAAIWDRCSTSEKVVLQHVAQDGFANVNDRQTIRRLLARGVICRQPHFELMNETFRRFVLTDARRREVAAAHIDPAASTWDKIEKPLMAALLCAAVFFVATQRELFDATMAMVTAVATGIPTLVRMAGFVAQPRGLLGVPKA
jgi:hypothetical protein